ncbi:MAG: type II toxin-antitoxin system HigB family toxin [bacterium]|nr:type II toxin-antitoxin system HigB family toxin [bacterium]
MHVISRKVLRRFWEQHPDSKGPLSRWFKAMELNSFSSLNELRAAFPNADKVGDLIVFILNAGIICDFVSSQ